MKYKIFIIIFTSIFYYNNVFSLTGDEIVGKFKERMAGISTMKGKVSISFQTGEIYSGNFKYMSPGRIYIKLNDPPGKIIVANDRKLWVHDSSSDVCGVQELDTGDKDKDKDKEDKKNQPERKGGIELLLDSYEIILSLEGQNGYSIELRNEKRKYSEIRLFLDSTFMLINAIFKNKDGEGFLLELSDVTFGEKILPSLFNFNVPASTQVVKNPLDVR